MAISDSTLSQDVWSDVRSALVSASIVTSLVSGTTVSTSNANITGQYPEKTVSKPQIVILPINLSEDTYKFGNNYGRKLINVVIECYSDKSVLVDQMADMVKEKLSTNGITGIDLVGLSEDYAFSSPGENRMHLKTVVATYRREV